MEDTLIEAFNRINDTNYATLAEIKGSYSAEEIVDGYLRSIGVIGRAVDIIEIVELAKK